MSIVSTLFLSSLRVNVMLAFRASNTLCRVLLTRYKPVVESRVRPNSSSKARHDSRGSHIWEIPASMSDRVDVGRRWIGVLVPLFASVIMDCIPTTRFRTLLFAKLKDLLFGVNRLLS